jgi:hypothetical protein
MNICLNRNHVGWIERDFAKPNKPKLQKKVLLFRFCRLEAPTSGGFRDEAAQPNLHNCASVVKVLK